MPDWFATSGPAAAWIAAIASCLALLVAWRNRVDAVRKQAREDAAEKPWANLHHTDDPSRVRVTFHNASDVRFRVTQARALRPRGAKIQAIQRASLSEDGVAAPAGPLATSIPLDWRVYAAPSDPKHADVSGAGELLIVLPPRSRLSQRLMPARELSLAIEFSASAIPPSRSSAIMPATLTVMP